MAIGFINKIVMKNIILILALSITYLNNITAQVLYTENFDNYTLGNLGTDVTGQTPGQGNWYTTDATNAQYTIITEPNKGKALSIFTNNPQQDQNFIAEKRNLNVLIDQRAAGNNVIKIEVDFYTGSRSIANSSTNTSRISFLFDPPQNYTNLERELIAFNFSHNIGVFLVRVFDGHSTSLKVSQFLTSDTWYQLIFYMDYTNKKGYFEIPGTNISGNGDFLTQVVNPSDFKLSKMSLTMIVSNLTSTTKREQRYDDIRITALKAVPPHLLNVESFLSDKFNLYPNPATNIVNITNSENMLVEQVTVYDITGKQLSTQSFDSEAEIQLNVGNLASGTYMLHLHTNDGTAVKKLIKK